jgi:hypothetical protein
MFWTRKEHVMSTDHDDGPRVRGNARAKWVLATFLAIAAYFLIAEDRAHLSGLLSYLPFLLLLLCPLMHVFMHGRHGGHRSHDHDSGSAAAHKQ